MKITFARVKKFINLRMMLDSGKQYSNFLRSSFHYLACFKSAKLKQTSSFLQNDENSLDSMIFKTLSILISEIL